MSKKSVIIFLIAIGLVLGFGLLIKYTQKSETPGTTQTENEAGKVGEGEFSLNDQNFKGEVLEYKGVAMVDFYSPACPYCKKVAPIVSEIAKETTGKYKIGKIDATKNPQTTATLKNFQSVPALVFYKDGKEVDRLIGLQDKQAILNKLKEVSGK